MEKINELYWTGNKLSRNLFFPTTFNKRTFSPTRNLPATVIESLKSSFYSDYQENLRLLFLVTGEVDLATKISFEHESDYYIGEQRLNWLESRGFVPVLNREMAFDLTPNTQNISQCFAWNNVVRDLLIKENENQRWYCLADEHLKTLRERVRDVNVDLIEAITQQLEAIEKVFPKNIAAVMYEDNTFPEFCYDNPDSLVQGIEDLELMSKLLTYLSVGKKIYFGQYINWWHHIQILNVEEVIKYRKKLIELKANPTLMDEPSNSRPAAQQVDDKKAIVEKYIRCFSGERKGYGKLLNEKDYSYLIEKTIELIESGKLPEELKAIPNIHGLTNDFIRRSYYLLHKEIIPGRKINREWLKFIKNVFSQFNEVTEDVLYKKFSQYSSNSLYEIDKESITNY